MDENNKGITFNIYGGNSQILPNATKAEQHFYGDLFAKEALRKGAPEAPPLTDEERRLLAIIEDEEKLRNYIAQFAICKTAADVGEVVALMCEHEPYIDESRIVTAKFIEIILPLIPGVEKGLGIDNLRVQISNAWSRRRQAIRRNHK